MNTHDIELPSSDEAAAHMLPSDLKKFECGEHVAEAFSIAVGNPDEISQPLFTLDQVRAAIEADRKLAGDLEAQLEKALTERDDYHDMADQLAEQIAAITDQEIGEHSSGNNPWQNAMLAADEWIAKDIRRLTDGVDRQRRGEPSSLAEVWRINADEAEAYGQSDRADTLRECAAEVERLAAPQPAQRALITGKQLPDGSYEAVPAESVETLKVPSIDEIMDAVWAYGCAHGMRKVTATELVTRWRDIRALLTRYGNNKGESNG